MSQCEHTVHRAALVPSASPQEPIDEPNGIWRHLLPSGDFQASRDRDADRLRSRDDRSPPSHPATNRGRERAASPVPATVLPGEGSAPATAPIAINIRREQATKATAPGQGCALATAPRRRARDGANTRDKLRGACRHRPARQLAMAHRPDHDCIMITS